ncbi:hypothetical protein BJY52DRAFT_321839 [Lactarius psammicola]|nr:hypothetical protein BJY52DRAFT_321839 [Lactarius psammicola]
MSISRPESHYGRRRSNTALSAFKGHFPQQPLELGASKVLTAWVHGAGDSSSNVILNHAHLPGVAAGDLLSVTLPQLHDKSRFLFLAPSEDPSIRPQLQISLPKPVAEAFAIRNNTEVTVTKVDRAGCQADYLELIFQDQYLGRNDMWRLSEQLSGHCVYLGQEVVFIGSVAAKVDSIYVGGQKVSSGLVTASTKAIHRSLSAKVTIFIQVCRELWEFSGDGERYNEKIVHSFLPELFTRWKEAGTNHTVTIVLISRVFYDRTEVDYAEGPLLQDEDGRWHKDFFKVITDLEVLYDWQSTLVSLKDSFWAFQRDILLTHHYHRTRTTAYAPTGTQSEVRLVGQLSFAHDGPLLEALNMALNPTETHYIDRSLSLTGSSTIVITPGTGYYRVSKQLLRLTSTRMLDQGFGIDLVSLAKPPLHRSPIFSFRGVEPELFRVEKLGRYGSRALDPLWGGDDGPTDCIGREKKTFWWEPFWIGISFWDKQMDLPLREDRFVARAKMHEIQMLGLLDHDVLSSIEVPYLPEQYASLLDHSREGNFEAFVSAKRDADKFDTDIFEFKDHEVKPLSSNRTSGVSIGGATPMPSSIRIADKRAVAQHRTSHPPSNFLPIEESPRPSETVPLPVPRSEKGHLVASLSVASTSDMSTSPSQASVRSVRSNRSDASTSSTQGNRGSPRGPTSLLRSKITPWLFNPFRSGPSQAVTSTVSVSGESTPIQSAHRPSTALSPTTIAGIEKKSPVTQPHTISPLTSTADTWSSPRPMPIKGIPRSRRPKAPEDMGPITHSPLAKYLQSPMNTPPRDESQFEKRRSIVHGSSAFLIASSSPTVRLTPSGPQIPVSYSDLSLARRWLHMFPHPVFKHDIKWRSMVTPGCLPLTTEEFPSTSELETSYDVFSYDFVVDPPETGSFLVRPPAVQSHNPDEVRRAWALVVMRGMIALRLAQGFQIVLRPANSPAYDPEPDPRALRRSKSYVSDEDITPRPTGAAEALRAQADPVYLSMSNEIHRIAYTGEAIQVRRYVRRMPPTHPLHYKCLVWPKLGAGYTELSLSFAYRGLENYGWNRLDMLVAGYEQQFNESLRYWRTRFVVIPTLEPPTYTGSIGGSMGDKLNEEEIRILGIEKLTDMFSRVRWQPSDERGLGPGPSVRLLVTDVGPAAMVLDDHLMARLNEIHAAGPLRKKMKSERDIADMSLAAIAKAMREEEGIPIKEHRWQRHKYPDSFLGYEFVNWLVREFRDVSTRDQATEWGGKLQDQGLLEHCTGRHGFFDGHYFYRLKGEYAIASTPKGGWFRSKPPAQTADEAPRSGHYPSSLPRTIVKKTKKRIILSQSMVIDMDPNKKSDQAETVILHHDLIHNPATIFHFELHWIGTAARCIEDMLRVWTRTIERYGLTLVEAYVSPISDIADRNPFQSCFPMRLAVQPPIVVDIEKRVPEHRQGEAAHYFEYSLLRRFGFVLDIEATNSYPAHVDAVYSYRRTPFAYSQFVHRSGVAFVQVLGGTQGFLFLTNRLMGSGRVGANPVGVGKAPRPAAGAEELRIRLQAFCADKEALVKFYDEELAQLVQVPDEPPLLSI